MDTLQAPTDAPYVVRIAPDVEVRRSGDGRTVRGILMPWDAPARVYDRHGPTGRPAAYTEAVKRGAFDAMLGTPERVKFLGHHNRLANPLGRAALLRNDALGLYGELYVSRTAAGDEVLELINDGALDAFSVGMVPRESTMVGDVYYRTNALLLEASIVTFAAYEGAEVLGVRSAQPVPTDSGDLAAGAGVGESPAEGGSGDQPEGATAVRTGMTPTQRQRAIAVAHLKTPKE